MKLISSAIIVLTGGMLILGGAHVQHQDTQLFVMGVGCVVGLAGLWGWYTNIQEKYERNQDPL